MTFIRDLADRHANQVRARVTDLPREAFERDLTCTSCGLLIAVFEAAAGARTQEEHQHVDPDTFVCIPCNDKPMKEDSP